MSDKIIGYYVEIFHTRQEGVNTFYLMQSNIFKSIEQAYDFVKQLSFVDDEIGLDLMILVGENEEDYDIEKLGHFQQVPIDIYRLEITNHEYSTMLEFEEE